MSHGSSHEFKSSKPAGTMEVVHTNFVGQPQQLWIKTFSCNDSTASALIIICIVHGLNSTQTIFQVPICCAYVNPEPSLDK